MPSEVPLAAESRTATGSRAGRRLRREGRVPAVVYGLGSDPRPITVVRRDLRTALTTEAGANALLDLTVDGDGQTLLTLVKEMQRDPVRNEVTHVDFIQVSRDVAVVVEVPIVLEGEASEVVGNDGTLEQQLFALTVSAKPGDIPGHLELDVSSMAIGDTLRVGDVSLPAGVTTDVDPEEPVAIAQVSQAAQEAEALAMEAAAALAEEGGEAPEGEGAPEAAEASAEGAGDEAAEGGEPDSSG